MKKILIISMFWLSFINCAQAEIPDGYSSFCSTIGDFFNDWLSIDSRDGLLKVNSRLAGSKHYINPDFLNLNHDDYSIELSVSADECDLVKGNFTEFSCEASSATVKFRNRDETVVKTLNNIVITQSVVSKRKIQFDVFGSKNNKPFISIINTSCNNL